MKKGFALFSCLLIITSMLFISIPSGALNYSKNQNLSNIDASFYGEYLYNNSGFSVAGAGDVNGDGYDDILIGAPGINDGGGSGIGKTYLVFGKESGWNRDINISMANASFIGEYEDDYSGISVAGAGDVNGDGFDDILIGAPGDGAAGHTYLILGKASGWTKNTSLSKADASFIGDIGGESSGTAVAGAGDVNGDGFDDILIGAYRYSGSHENQGQTYLIFGKASGWAKNISLSKADATFIGTSDFYTTGSSVAGIGDVNGDGYDDILIGTYDANYTYLIFGKASGWAKDTSLFHADASFVSPRIGSNAGFSIAGVGDVNGDGYDDILIGAYYESIGFPMTGTTYLILGKTSGWSLNTSLANADASFIGEHPDDYSGYSVIGAKDVNGDGYDDFLVGAPGADNINNIGKTYLLLGKASGWSMNTSLSKADGSFMGEHAGDFSGSSIAGAGDVNGDGYDDILIGAPYNNDGGGMAGKTYLIIMDSNSKPTSVNSIKAFSNDNFSFEISKASENDTVFVELDGVDSNSSRNDIALVRVASSTSDPIGFTLRLLETGMDTGIYRGNFTIKNKTHTGFNWVKASVGETVILSSVQDSTKKVTIVVVAPLLLFPTMGPININEDQPVNIHFWASGPGPITWHETVNNAWLVWDGQAHNISGIPDNSDVGLNWINVTVTIDGMGPRTQNYTMIVNNTPPKIITTDVTSVLQDRNYGVDYNSTDDGQGTITWHLKTNASDWLTMNSSTGYLSGKPVNKDVGKYYVNISVDDGNGGWDRSNFILTVVNVNDVPVITSMDCSTAYQDHFYSVQYKVQDIDVGDVLTWSLRTNTSNWLQINSTTGLLSGIPSNADVGFYWANVTVMDLAHAYDFRNFSLTVVNVNDPPKITSVPVTIAITNIEYKYQVRVIDVDVGDILNYSLDVKPTGMNINNRTGLITWTPAVAQMGDNSVVVNVTDGKVAVIQSFKISVKVPVAVTLLAPKNNTQGTVTRPNLQWSYQNHGNTNVHFDVYLSEDISKVNLKDTKAKVIGNRTELEYTPSTDLIRGMTYYWTIRPFDSYTVGLCLDGTWAFTVAPNTKPVVSAIPNITVKVGDVFTYQVNASDPDIGDILTYSIANKPVGMSISSSGLISWIPTKDQIGDHIILVSVTDGKDQVNIQFKITVKKKDSTNGYSGLSFLEVGVIVAIIIAILAIVLALHIKGKKNKLSNEDEELMMDEPDAEEKKIKMKRKIKRQKKKQED